MPIVPGSLPDAVLILGMTPENFNFSMGLTGMISAFVIFLIWSRGL